MLEINKKDKVLFKNKWAELRKKSNGYVYLHSPWCDGVGVAVLAFRKLHSGSEQREYLGRYEVTPCHSREAKLCSITGGYDNADKFDITGCALNELSEEGGYIAPTEAVIHLGTVLPSKQSDTVVVLFAVDLDHPEVKTCKATGDGTVGERGSYAKWVSEEDLVMATDPLNHAMLMRLKLELEK